MLTVIKIINFDEIEDTVIEDMYLHLYLHTYCACTGLSTMRGDSQFVESLILAYKLFIRKVKESINYLLIDLTNQSIKIGIAFYFN